MFKKFDKDDREGKRTKLEYQPFIFYFGNIPAFYLIKKWLDEWEFAFYKYIIISCKIKNKIKST